MSTTETEGCDKPRRRPGRFLYWAVALLVCLAVAAALAHVNLWSRASFPTCETIGWPIIYGARNIDLGGEEIVTTLHPTMLIFPWQWEDTHFRIVYIFWDVLMSIVLIVAPGVVFAMRWRAGYKKSQFGLADLFALTTAVAVLCSLFSLDRTIALVGPRGVGEYSPLSAYLWYDQAMIGLAIGCLAYVLTLVVCRMVRR